MKPRFRLIQARTSAAILSLTFTAAMVGGVSVMASSHSDAPLIKQDPQANLTDVYAFIGKKYDDLTGTGPNVLNVIVSVRPFSDPGDGVIYERFADDALYSIHITNPTTGAETLRYDFQFSNVSPTTAPGLKNPNTILSYGNGGASIETTGDSGQNFTQTYSVIKNGSVVTAFPGSIAPPNVGGRTTPAYNDSSGRAVSGATDFTTLDAYTQETINDLTDGAVAWAGPREDGFYADTPGIFDLLDGRILNNDGDGADGLGQDGGGIDGFQGFNVLTYAIQIPVSQLQASGYTAAFANLANGIANGGAAQNTGVGVYASVSRKRITLRRSNAKPLNTGTWLPVNRLGNPLFNEVLVALKDKDNYNRTFPVGDAAYSKYAQNPEVAALINLVFGTQFQTTGRGDLALVFIPDVLRVDTTTGPVRVAGDPGFSRFGFAGGDTVTNAAGRAISSGWPNGRRAGDDVVDIALTAVASGPSYSTVTVVGDNVGANDQTYNRTFPYLGTPHAGTTTTQRSAPAPFPAP